MILTCPECATSYFVDDLRIPAVGRTVKCSNCGVRWLARKDAAEVSATGEAGQPAQAAAAPGGLAPGEPPAALPTAKAAARARKPGQVKVATRTVASVAAAVAALLAAAGVILFRGEIIGLWPASARAYAAVGLSVGPPGLVIEAVKAEPAFVLGRPVLAVTGQIHNTGTHDQQTPPLSLHLLDGSGKVVAARIARVENPQAPAGARRYFKVVFEDPPQGVQNLDVAFAPPGRKLHASPPANAQPPAAAAAAPIAPEEAKPLPPGSPDALPDHG